MMTRQPKTIALSLPLILQCISITVFVSSVLFMSGCSKPDESGAEAFIKSQQMLVMKQNDRVYGLNALGKEITPEVAENISKLRGLKNLDLARCSLTNENLTVAIEPLNLVSIVLSDTPVEDIALECLSDNSKLEAIFLSNTGITDNGLKSLGSLGKLAELNLASTKITSAGLSHISGLKNLKRLILTKTAIDDSALEHIKGIKSLAKLEIQETQVTGTAVSDLTQAIPGLTVDK